MRIPHKLSLLIGIGVLTTVVSQLLIDELKERTSQLPVVVQDLEKSLLAMVRQENLLGENFKTGNIRYDNLVSFKEKLTAASGEISENFQPTVNRIKADLGQEIIKRQIIMNNYNYLDNYFQQLKKSGRELYQEVKKCDNHNLEDRIFLFSSKLETSVAQYLIIDENNDKYSASVNLLVGRIRSSIDSFINDCEPEASRSIELQYSTYSDLTERIRKAGEVISSNLLSTDVLKASMATNFQSLLNGIRTDSERRRQWYKQIGYISIFAIAGLMLLFGMIVIRSITYPLSKLITYTESLKAGNLDISTPPMTNDELGVLNQALHDMSHHLIEANQELKIKTEQLSLQAYHDSLTGLPNRIQFSKSLEKLFANAVRSESSFAVLFIDLDGFKQINDNYGHDVGDVLLVEISRRFERCIRKNEIIARIGGDEFIALVNTTRSKAELDSEKVAQRILEEASQPVEINGITLSVSASIGISIYPNNAQDSQILLKLADDALYEVKNNNKNGYKLSNKTVIEPD